MENSSLRDSKFAEQAGGGLLVVVATLGLVMALVQGSLYYKAKTGAKFISSEKSKIEAQQIAEAGVEDNIAAIGNRSLRINSAMHDYVSFDNKGLGEGAYTSKISMVAPGAIADTVDLTSTAVVGKGTQSVQARLRLKKYIDSTLATILHVDTITTTTFGSHTVPETTSTTTIMSPSAMPDLDKTSAYAAWLASGVRRADICHLPGGDLTKANVITVDRSSVSTHISHHGDYVTTDGTCDLYKPKITKTVTYKTVTDTTKTVSYKTTIDTTVTLDTMFKVQILSWK